ncbi:hypothetical protein SETIT_8G029700v2 [Setaria italica]|uniref:Uncharacterized protein n=1 Tax=Setaria italica TaxID=4555 RepID=A0A368S3T8_SETIT|nr:hypothetical protein SETIT_8G029700v2 [Setaria italica]
MGVFAAGYHDWRPTAGITELCLVSWALELRCQGGQWAFWRLSADLPTVPAANRFILHQQPQGRERPAASSSAGQFLSAYIAAAPASRPWNLMPRQQLLRRMEHGSSPAALGSAPARPREHPSMPVICLTECTRESAVIF